MLTVRDMMAGSAEAIRAGGPGSGRRPSFELSDKATGNRVHDALRSIGYSYKGNGMYEHPDGYRAAHVNPNGFVNRLHVKDADEDHLAKVEQTLDEKGLKEKGWKN